MAPRKAQSWAKVRAAGIAANKTKNLSATPQSAWRALTQQNNEHEGRLRALIDRKEEEAMFEEGDGDDDADEGGEKKGKKKNKKKQQQQQQHQSTIKSNPNPKKITKPSITRKRKASASRRITAKTHPPSPSSTDPEFWRPYGGETTQDSPPSTCLGLARLSTWQYDAFKAAVEELFDQYAPGAAEVEAEEWKQGGESVTDVQARFGSVEQAMMIKGQIEGEMVRGRKLQVRVVDDG